MPSLHLFKVLFYLAQQKSIQWTFIDRFAVSRGVRQGCPLALLLFALVSQPLMVILKGQLTAGEIQGITTGEQSQLLYQLFANDTGILFEAIA
jgi:hypothetical protein